MGNAGNWTTINSLRQKNKQLQAENKRLKSENNQLKGKIIAATDWLKAIEQALKEESK